MVNAPIPKHLQTDDWKRLPKPGDRLMDMTRSTLYEIIQDPDSGVRSAVIRKAGRTRGIRLIWMPSLYSYLNRLAGLEESNSSELLLREDTSSFGLTDGPVKVVDHEGRKRKDLGGKVALKIAKQTNRLRSK
jgi:hypothetical protein